MFIYNKKAKSTLFKHVSLLVVTALSACSYAPGLHVGEFESQPSSNLLHSDNENDSNIPTHYISSTGLDVKIVTLNKNNIPRPININNNAYSDVRPLLKSHSYGDYRVSAGDTLSINLWAYPEILGNQQTLKDTHGYTVSQTGKLYLPLIGSIEAKNKTVAQIRNEVRVRYAKYLKQADVDVKVISFKSKAYSVMGKVRQPGEFYIDDKPATLMSALGKAGGLLENADEHNIRLQRDGQTFKFGLPVLEKLGIPSNRIYMQNGDTLVVGSNTSRKVYLMGEAKQLVSLVIPTNGMSLANVLGESQGVNPNTANAAKIYVVRDNAKKHITHLYRLDLSKIENLALANRFKMQTNDVVYVDATGLTRWNRVINSILPSATAITTGRTLGIK